MEENGFAKARPMQNILDDEGEGHEHIRALGNDNFIAAYIYSGRGFTMKPPFAGDTWWIDPASDVRSYFGKINTEMTHFSPPVKKIGHNDWVLLIKRVVN